MEKLKQQADTNRKYNDREEDREEDDYCNDENPEVVENTQKKISNGDTNTNWKTAYEKMEETCRILKNKLGYPDDFEYSDESLMRLH